MATTVTPWWKALKIRQEIMSASGQIDDVQMSLFAAVHGTGASRPLYADATYYGEITHPTERLVDLLTEIAIRIGAGEDYLKARAVTRLDQGMGGNPMPASGRFIWQPPPRPYWLLSWAARSVHAPRPRPAQHFRMTSGVLTWW